MTLICIVLVLAQLFFWYYFYGILIKNQPVEPKNGQNQAVSILICAKNEIDNLKENLPAIIDQTYIEYKVIVADDYSSDGTTEFLKKIDSEKGIFTAFKVKENKRGKKAALSEALTQAKTPWVLTTDADCVPCSEDWISSMMNSAEVSDITLVLGYSPYQKEPNLVSKWAHFEAWITAVQYLSYAKRGIPYMGVGRNLLYKKDLINKETLSNYAHLASGDDDLTVMQIATADNTAINLDPKSFVMTTAPPTFLDYWKQKNRHFSTATSYQWKHKILLSLYSSSQILFFVLILLLFLWGQWLVAVGIYGFRMLMLFPSVFKLKKILTAEFSLLCFPLYDVAQAFYYMIFSIAALIPQKTKW